MARYRNSYRSNTRQEKPIHDGSRLCPACGRLMLTSKYNKSELYCSGWKTGCKHKARIGEVAKDEVKSIKLPGSDQQEAIFAAILTDTPQCIGVNAGAGTGKTWTLIQTLIRWCEKNDGKKALAVAFGVQAKNELSSRVPTGISASVDVKTYNALGFGMLNRVHRMTGNRGSLEVKDGKYRNYLADRFEQDKTPWGVISAVCTALTKLRQNLYYDVTTGKPTSEDVEKVICDYGVEIEANDRELFDDLLKDAWAYATRPLTQVLVIDFEDQNFLPCYFNLTGEKYPLVLIDEAQDTSKSQMRNAIASVKELGTLVYVGDQHQMIYSWRGADPLGMDLIGQRCGLPLRIFPLTLTRRCPKAVVRFANALHPELEALEDAPEGEVFDVNKDDLLENIRDSVIFTEGALILCRINAPLVSFCLKLISQGIPAKMRGRDFCSELLTLIDNLSEETNELTVLLDNLTQWENSQLEKFARMGQRGQTAAQTTTDKADSIRAVAENDKIKTVKELKEFLDVMFRETGLGTEIVCSTVHRAKGSEHANNVIFAEPGKNGSIFDPVWGGTPYGEEERDNLCLVAVTRSKLRTWFVDGRPAAFRDDEVA